MKKTFLAILGGILISALSVFGAAAQQAEIEGTITSQIDAFKADDFDQAFTYATPSLQRLFQTPQNFERMVTQGYPMVWRPAEVTYLELEDRGSAMFQKVQILDAKGVTYILLYQMEETDQGWRIGGVQILEKSELSA